jgi:hypothetical protein
VSLAQAQAQGDTASIERSQKSIESYRTNGIGLALKYIDEELLVNCDRGQLRSDLLSRIEPARILLNESEPVVAVEAMPELRITGISSNFIPIETDANGSCSGPYIDLNFTVVNSGGDFPRQSDLKTNRERVQDAPDKMRYFNIIADLDFGAAGKGGQHVIAADRSQLGGDVLKRGGALNLPYHLRVQDNQVRVTITAKIEGAVFLKVANDSYQSSVYETAIDIPIWDISPFSNATVIGETEKGQSDRDQNNDHQSRSHGHAGTGGRQLQHSL